jgi:hypothetical protein
VSEGCHLNSFLMFRQRLPHLVKRQMGILNRKSVNQRVSEFEYAVRGAQAIRAEELKQVAINNVANSKRPNCCTLQANCEL